MPKQIIEKLISLSVKPITDAFLKKKAVHTILREFGIQILKREFDSIYINAVVEYGVGKSVKELIELFADNEIKEALKIQFITGENNLFKEAVEKVFKNGDFYFLRLNYSKEQIFIEADEFQYYFDLLSKKTESPFALKQYYEEQDAFNKIIENLDQLVEHQIQTSFEYQAGEYIKRIKSEFHKNKYVQLDGLFLESNHGLKAQTKWLKANVRDTSIGSNLISLYEEWKNNGDNFLLVLGEYGTGKTTSLKFFQNILIQHFCDSLPVQTCFPIFLSLHNFEKSLESFIVTEFNKYGITELNYEKFIQRLESGQLLLILDGFDEMATGVDSTEKGKNFSKIKRLLQYTKAKIILSVRKEFFISQYEFNNTFELQHRSKNSIIEILPFSRNQIVEFLINRGLKANYLEEVLEKNLQIEDLAKRPVLLELLIDYLPAIANEGKENIVSTDLYSYCINEELRRKSNIMNFEVPSQIRIKILEQACIWMFENNTLNFDIENIKAVLRPTFPFAVNEWQFEKYLNEFLAFTFLLNDEGTKFRISHKSFRDFLVAKFFFNEITKSQKKILASFGNTLSTFEIDQFIIELGLKEEDIRNKIVEFKTMGENTLLAFPYFISNCINLLLRMGNSKYQKNIDFTKSSIDLSNSNLGNINPLVHLPLNVNVLNLSNNNIRDISAFKFLNVHNFRVLDMSHNLIDNISPLNQHTQIVNLDLSFNKISVIENVTGLLKLNSLNLNSNLIQNIGFLRNINTNTINRKLPVKEKSKEHEWTEIKDLYKVAEIRILKLANNKLSDISPLNDLQGLNVLNIQNNLIENLAQLENCRSLTEIQLNRNRLRLNDLKEFNSKMPKLKLDLILLSFPIKDFSLNIFYSNLLKAKVRDEYLANRKLLRTTNQFKYGVIEPSGFDK